MFLDLIANYFPYALAALVLAVLLGVAAVFRKSPTDKTPYQQKNALLSSAEFRFYRALLRAAPDHCTVFSKVRIADVLQVQKGLDKSEWQTAFNKISAKHFDFVLCDNNDMSVHMAIELDDKSHNSKQAIARDKFVNAACASAGLPLLRIKASSDYDVDSLHAQLNDQLRSLPEQ